MGVLGCMAAPQAAAPLPPPHATGAKEPTVAIALEPKLAVEPQKAVTKKDPGAESDAEVATGNMQGDQIGDSFGEGGLGLAGVGEGGGGRGEGIGIGSVGGIGHGAGTGAGQGYGSGAGRLGGSSTGGSRGKVQAATATSTGSGLPPEVIQRIVRQRLSLIRYCYEKAMERDPTIGGKIAVKFTINATGAVSQAAAGDTTISDATMVSCVVAAVRGLSFPQPENGGVMVVTYPFNFSPADN